MSGDVMFHQEGPTVAGRTPIEYVLAYQSHGQHDVLFDWLDFELQKSTLRNFSPEDAEAWIEPELLWFQRPKAA